MMEGPKSIPYADELQKYDVVVSRSSDGGILRIEVPAPPIPRVPFIAPMETFITIVLACAFVTTIVLSVIARFKLQQSVIAMGGTFTILFFCAFGLWTSCGVTAQFEINPDIFSITTRGRILPAQVFSWPRHSIRWIGTFEYDAAIRVYQGGTQLTNVVYEPSWRHDRELLRRVCRVLRSELNLLDTTAPSGSMS